MKKNKYFIPVIISLLVLFFLALTVILLNSTKSVTDSSKAAVNCKDVVLSCPDGSTKTDTNTDPNSCPSYSCLPATSTVDPIATVSPTPPKCKDALPLTCPTGQTKVDTNTDPSLCPVYKCVDNTKVTTEPIACSKIAILCPDGSNKIDTNTDPNGCPHFVCVTNTPVPNNASCLCGSDNLCSNSCSFNTVGSVSYGKDGNGQISCSRENGVGPASSQTDKDNYCKPAAGKTQSQRTSGDADNDGVVEFLDYSYYVRAVNGGQIPANINPDFNGDGLISPSDRTIVINALKLSAK